MIKYFRRVSLDPIRTMEDAEETIKQSVYGFYSLGIFALVLWVCDLATEGNQIESSDIGTPYGVIAFLLFVGPAFFIHQVRSRIAASISAAIWTLALLYQIPSFLLIVSFQQALIETTIRVLAIVLAWFAFLFAIGGLRGTLQFHELKRDKN